MRLVTFAPPGGGAPRVGRLEGDAVVELEAASMIDWLRGAGHEARGPEHELDGVRLLAPVPEPPSVRDFYAYEGHVAAGWRRRGADIPEAWYEAPAFYFSNPASIHGPDEPISPPAATAMLDFELELAAIVGGDGAIAGFTLLNDWSARDIQAREMTVGLGPHKGKDFALSLGPWLVTPDELPWADGRLDLELDVTVNGNLVTRARAREQHFAWDELVAHAARDTRLRPGDVLGSGTLNGGCLLELGPQPLDGPDSGPRWLSSGDVVAFRAPVLGALRSHVGPASEG